jgi:hypothetical protein
MREWLIILRAWSRWGFMLIVSLASMRQSASVSVVLPIRWSKNAQQQKKVVVSGLIGGPEGMYSSSALATSLAKARISGNWETFAEKVEVMWWTNT